MKKLLFLAIFISKMAYSQTRDSCNCDRPAWSLSTNFRVVTAEVLHVAQKTRMGFIMGASIFTNTEQGDKEDSYKVLGYDLSLYATYKLLHRKNVYSLHLLTGAVLSTEDDLYWSSGFEFRKPITLNKKDHFHDKMLFFRGLYPLDFRAGMIFNF